MSGLGDLLRTQMWLKGGKLFNPQLMLERGQTSQEDREFLSANPDYTYGTYCFSTG